MNAISYSAPISYSFDSGETQSSEFKIQVLRDCGPAPLADCPAKAIEYIKTNVLNSVRYCSDKENFVVLFLNTRRQVTGFEIISQGLLDSVSIHPREIFCPAIATKAHSIIVAHNHPTGDTSPSEADIRVTRDIIRAGQLLKIELADHIIFTAEGKGASMKELGFFYI